MPGCRGASWSNARPTTPGARRLTVPTGPIVLAVLAAALGSLFASADAAMNALPEARLQTLVEEANEAEFARYARDRLRVLSRWLVARIVTIAVAAVLFTRVAEQELGPFSAALVAVAA